MTQPRASETSDFRLYLEEKFKSIHQRLNTIDEKNEDIDLSVKELSHIVETMRIVEGKHFLTCPNTAEIGIIRKDVAELTFIKKYYKVFLFAGVLAIGILVGSGVKAWYDYRDVIMNDQIIQKQVNKNTKQTNNNKTDIENLKEEKK